MISKIIIKMIMNELLNEVFYMYMIKFYYHIKNKNKNYEITVTASYKNQQTMITKYEIIHIKNWIELLVNYNNIKLKLRNSLAENIKEGVC